MIAKKKMFSARPFDKLKKKIESMAAVPTPAPAPRKKKEDHTDEDLFNREMNDVLVIEEFHSLACVPRSQNRRKARVPSEPDHDALDILREISEGRRPIPLPDTQEYVEWIHPAFRDDIIQRLHDGRFAVQSYLDLHGFFVPDAEEELDDFLSDALKKGLGCVKIIHGRGLRSVKGARLKDVVVKRLSGHFRKDIIAYVTARQCDGGLGALYVLLARR
jgi:DNA-nicking Smr family endonuclease